MRFLKTFSICLVTLALHGTAWAEIYETTDAQGNPDFSDSPPGEVGDSESQMPHEVGDFPDEDGADRR